MNKNRLKTIILRSVLFVGILFIFFGISIGIQKRNSNEIDPKSISLPIKMFIQGNEPLHAAEPSLAWHYVRSISTFTRNTSLAINDLLVTINNSPLVDAPTYVGPADNYNLEWNGNANITITREPGGSSGALLGTFTYTKKLRVFNTAATPELLVELYYNPVSEGGEILVRWKPKLIDPVTYATAADTAIVECQVTGAAGSRTMMCGFSGGPFASPATPNWSEQVMRVEETADEIKFAALSKTNAAYDPDGAAAPACANDIYYFPLAFIAKKNAPYYTTAKFGFNIANISDNVCGLYTNTANYGLFNTNANPNAVDESKYFVSEGVASANIPAAYPVAADVDTLFATIADGGAPDADGLVGKDILDGVAIAFEDITIFPAP